MAALVDAAEIDVVTWLPTSAARRRDRGFDQSALLARAVARRLRRPCRPLLRRQPGPPQTGRDRRARLTGPRLTARAAIAGTVLVVDDVVTTGASATAAAIALRAAGASRVLVVAAARTPLKALRSASETRK
jgi:predicted amidophosphoribosyltransferase